jgi:hypothetical protein
MIEKLSAQAAEAPAVRPPATGRPPVASAPAAAVPQPAADWDAARTTMADAVLDSGVFDPEERNGNPGDPRAPAVRVNKYRVIFACASHARDTSTEGQPS